MTGVEIVLLLAGCVFMVGSFFITEKLSPSELNKIAELSEEELKRIIDRGIVNAGNKIEEAIYDKIDASSDMVERALEKETNEKIMAISEFSDTVIETMNKTHNEVMFLYSMLNDKHSELTGMANDLQRLLADIRNLQETTDIAMRSAAQKKQEQRAGAEDAKKNVPDSLAAKETKKANAAEKENHNQEILLLSRDGMSEVEIARKLGLGIGEVKLVIGLYRGELNA